MKIFWQTILIDIYKKLHYGQSIPLGRQGRMTHPEPEESKLKILGSVEQKAVSLQEESIKQGQADPASATFPSDKTKLDKGRIEIWRAITNIMRLERQAPPILSVSRDADLPLSFAQQRLWFLNQLEPDNPFYNEPTAIRIKGSLNVAALEQSLNEIVRRHETLRTTFVTVNGQPVQVIASALTLALPVVNLREVSDLERDAETQRLATEEAQQRFDLTQGSLLRTTLLQLGEEEHVLLLTIHHIVFDEWSMGVLLRELATLYEAFSNGKRSPLVELSIQYADFAVWQRQWLSGEVLKAQLTYWKQQLSGKLPVLQIPTARPRPATQTFRGTRQSLVLPKTLTEELKALSQREGVTLFMTLLAAFQTLLSRYTGQNDILVGTPIANRNRVETKDLIGFFPNTLVLRTNLSGNPTFQELLGRVREVALGTYAHQALPFEKLVEELQPERDLSYQPLFQVMFILQNTPMPALELSDLTLNFLELHTGTAKFDLTLELNETSESLKGWFEYNTDLFDAATIARMANQFRILLEGVVADPDQRLSDLPLLTEQERQQLLVDWNDTQADYPKQACIHCLFESQVEQTPDNVAVLFKDEQLTYRELNHRANQLAHHLQSLGVEPDVLVGICVERSFEMAIAVLGILKAGGAYVPLDPAYPQQRLAFMLEDVSVPVLLTQQRLVERLQSHGAKVVCLDTDCKANAYGSAKQYAQHSLQNPKSGVTADNLAYVIYTSGSTGRPKGVAMTHRSLSNLLSWQLGSSTLNSKAKTLQFAPMSFDVCFQEIFSTWCSGGTLVLISEEVRRDPARLLRFLSEEAVERLFLPFVALQHLTSVADAQGAVPMSLRSIVTAGEQLQITRQIANWFRQLKDCSLQNQYGPSESHVVTAFTLTGSPNDWPALPPIGRPIANTRCFLLDAEMQVVPVGVPGELYIGGVGLARGYLNRPDVTAERFIPNPFSDQPGTRLYRTGDLARYLPDGNIEFLGRIDHQVKIRGFRIELGEIEAVLLEHPQVQGAIVIDREDVPGDKRLVAYVVLNVEQTPTLSKLRRFLKEKLPDYMVPSAFVELSALPMTPNGKVERRALLPPDQARSTFSGDFVAPRSIVEHLLTQIWEELLNIQSIGIQDNFFELGGNSLLAVRMMHQIEQVCGHKLSLSTLYKEATVEHLVRVLLQQETRDFQSPVVEIQSGKAKRPFFFLHGILRGGGFYCLNLVRYLGKDQPFYALHPHGFDGEQIPLSIEAMAADRLETVRAIQPEGPYLLGGYCNGALVAFEMARQLQAQGQKVDLLVLIEASATNTRFRLLYSLVTGFGYWLGLGAEQQLSWFVNVRIFIRSLKRWLELGIDELFALVLKKLRSRIKWLDQADTPEDPEDIKMKFYRNRVLIGYIPRQYPGQVTLFRADEEPLERSNDPTWGWSKVAKEVAIYWVPGDHTTVITKHVQVLAEKLRTCLDKAQADD